MCTLPMICVLSVRARGPHRSFCALLHLFHLCLVATRTLLTFSLLLCFLCPLPAVLIHAARLQLYLYLRSSWLHRGCQVSWTCCKYALAERDTAGCRNSCREQEGARGSTGAKARPAFRTPCCSARRLNSSALIGAKPEILRCRFALWNSCL